MYLSALQIGLRRAIFPLLPTAPRAQLGPPSAPSPRRRRRRAPPSRAAPPGRRAAAGAGRGQVGAPAPGVPGIPAPCRAPGPRESKCANGGGCRRCRAILSNAVKRVESSGVHRAALRRSVGGPWGRGEGSGPGRVLGQAAPVIWLLDGARVVCGFRD